MPTLQICVSYCPDRMFTWPMAIANASLRKSMICKLGVNPETSAKVVTCVK